MADIIPSTFGPEYHAAGVRLCLRLRAALEPWRGKDRGVDLIFALADAPAEDRPAIKEAWDREHDRAAG